MTRSATRAQDWTIVAEMEIEPKLTRVFEHGWQSWSPTTWYRWGEPPHRPVTDRNRLICYRPERIATAGAYWGEGLLAVAVDGGPTHVFGTLDPAAEVPSIRVTQEPGRPTWLRVEADGPVTSAVWDLPGEEALAAWADGLAPTARSNPARPAPTIWSHWYHYFDHLGSDDIRENLAALRRNGLAAEVVEVDDGYQQQVGDWLKLKPGFTDLPVLVDEIRQEGRRAGIWLAPWLVAEKSELAAAHPQWLVRDDSGEPVVACHNWGQALFALDSTHPAAAEWLRRTVEAIAAWGVDFFKLDFVFAGALEGRRHEDVSGVEAYRRGLGLVRSAMAEGSHILGCGAPIIPSVGLVDSMRVSPDVHSRYEPADGDLSQPAQRSAVLSGVGRAFAHGRWWANDADCLIVAPTVERREQWAAHVRSYTGLRGSSDRIEGLDSWGLEVTRDLLAVPGPDLLVPSPAGVAPGSV